MMLTSSPFPIPTVVCKGGTTLLLSGRHQTTIKECAYVHAKTGTEQMKVTFMDSEGAIVCDWYTLRAPKVWDGSQVPSNQEVRGKYLYFKEGSDAGRCVVDPLSATKANNRLQHLLRVAGVAKDAEGQPHDLLTGRSVTVNVIVSNGVTVVESVSFPQKEVESPF